MKNKKSILWAFLALVVFCVGAIATGSSSSSDFVISDGVLTSYTGSDTTVYVPDDVTTISVGAFDDATISVIYLPTSVTTVENDSFALCSADVKVVFEMTSPTSALPSGMENWGVANAGGQITTYTTSGVTTYTLSDVSTFPITEYAYIKDGTVINLLSGMNATSNQGIIYTNSIAPPSDAVDVSRDGDNSVRMWKEQRTSSYFDVYFWFNAEKLVMPEDMTSYFEPSSGISKLDTIDGLEYLDTSNTTNMSRMFYNVSYLENLDISKLDTSNVTDMSNMLSGNGSTKGGGSNRFNDLDFSNFDTSKVTNMSGMFAGSFNGLSTLDLSSFNTSNVTDMSGMFLNCSPSTNNLEIGLYKLDLSGFDTSKVTTMESMFCNSRYLNELNVSSFNTTNVTTMKNMFNGVKHIIELDLSSFYTPNLTDTTQMFYEHYFLEVIDMRNMNLSNVTEKAAMFNHSYSALTTIYVRTQADKDVINSDTKLPVKPTLSVIVTQ